MLSRLIIAFLPMSKSLLISWLQSPSAVILEPKKIKALTVPMVSPGISYDKAIREETLTWVPGAWGVPGVWGVPRTFPCVGSCEHESCCLRVPPPAGPVSSCPLSFHPQEGHEGVRLRPPCCLAKMGHRRDAEMALLFWTQLKPWCWERLKMKGEGGNRGRMVREHHQVNGHAFEQAPGDSEGQGSLGLQSVG